MGKVNQELFNEEEMLKIEKENKEQGERIERVLKEKGIDGLKGIDRAMAERFF